MTRLMREAIEALQQLPSEQQDDVARAVLQLAGIERWLRDEVVPGHAEYLADTSKAVPAEDILSRIQARRRVVVDH